MPSVSDPGALPTVTVEPTSRSADALEPAGFAALMLTELPLLAVMLPATCTPLKLPMLAPTRLMRELPAVGDEKMLLPGPTSTPLRPPTPSTVMLPGTVALAMPNSTPFAAPVVEPKITMLRAVSALCPVNRTPLKFAEDAPRIVRVPPPPPRLPVPAFTTLLAICTPALVVLKAALPNEPLGTRPVPKPPSVMSPLPLEMLDNCTLIEPLPARPARNEMFIASDRLWIVDPVSEMLPSAISVRSPGPELFTLSVAPLIVMLPAWAPTAPPVEMVTSVPISS